MKKFLIFFILLPIFFNCSTKIPYEELLILGQKAPPELEIPVTLAGESQITFETIKQNYGVTVLTDINSSIPSYWKDSPVNGKGTNADKKYYAHAAKIIDGALKTYPKSFLNNEFKSIGICSSLSFYDTAYGGTAVATEKRVLLLINGNTSLEWGIDTIHHELNHILFYNHDFPQPLWKSYNKSGFTYGNGGVEAIQNGWASTDRTESSFRDGFACQYGKSGIEEDAATIAEFAIGDKANFQSHALKYPIITKKFQVLKQFYYDLDHKINDKFWKEDIVFDEQEVDDKEIIDNPENKSYEEDALDEDENTSFLEYITVKSLDFYDYYNDSYYTSVFQKNSSTYIGYHLILNNPQGYEGMLEIEAEYIYPDGTSMGTFNQSFDITGKSEVICKESFGWNEAGYWEKGKYQVILKVQGQIIAKGSFTVK